VSAIGNSVVKGALSVMSPAQKHSFIMGVIDKGVAMINTDDVINLKDIQHNYANDEERSILLIVKKCLPTGALFVLSNGKLLRLPSNSRQPTVTVVLGEDDFINVAKGKKHVETVALTSLEADIIGDFIVRDFMIIRRLFRAFGHVISKLAEE
jgi:hypothetical protein